MVDVSHISKRDPSLRMTLPKKVQAIQCVKEEDTVIFYEVDGKIVLKKLE
ncbi:MAG: AbrB/MazE/SpoVT family DNA-binding domain-containing protein [Thermoplasmatales archaeon]